MKLHLFASCLLSPPSLHAELNAQCQSSAFTSSQFVSCISFPFLKWRIEEIICFPLFFLSTYVFLYQCCGPLSHANLQVCQVSEIGEEMSDGPSFILFCFPHYSNLQL